MTDLDPARVEQAARAFHKEWGGLAEARREHYRAMARTVLDAYHADPEPADPFEAAPRPWRVNGRHLDTVEDAHGDTLFISSLRATTRQDNAVAAVVVEAVNAYQSEHAQPVAPRSPSGAW